jgi:truncated hemoglobin YjbI
MPAKEIGMATPSLYDWVGGIDALETLTNHFYQRVRMDPILAPIFAGMDGNHPRHVAMFWQKSWAVRRFIRRTAAGTPKWCVTIWVAT